MPSSPSALRSSDTLRASPTSSTTVSGQTSFINSLFSTTSAPLQQDVQGVDGFGDELDGIAAAKEQALFRVVVECAEAVDHGWRLVKITCIGRFRRKTEPSRPSPARSKGAENGSPRDSPVIRYTELKCSSRPNQLWP